jgi:non-haem Fe2+, alpha-ketoglutarate-dependent halogenase
VTLISLINNLKSEGFVNFGRPPLSSQEIDELIQLSRDTVERLSPDHPHFSDCGSLTLALQCLPQHHPRIAELLDSVFSNPDIQLVLKSVLGPDYKIWQINFRRAMPGDRGLYLHQDSLGEFGLVILASESSNGEGATIFLPGSHLVKKTMKDWKVEIPPYLLMKIRNLFTPLIGKVGDVAFFFHRTWHGRYSNASNAPHDCIMMSFYPAGASFAGNEGYANWSAEFLSEIDGTELGRLIDPSIGTEKQENGRFKILSQATVNADTPYALAIETPQGQQPRLGNFKLRAAIFFIRVVMGTLRPIIHLARWLRLVSGRLKLLLLLKALF